eukprot:2349653-Amphidinium_carterae.1
MHTYIRDLPRNDGHSAGETHEANFNATTAMRAQRSSFNVGATYQVVEGVESHETWHTTTLLNQKSYNPNNNY